MIGDIEPKDEWVRARWGKFTASEIWKILGKGVGADLFGAGAKTYIRKKAIEKLTTFWENPKIEFAKPILWGKRYEEPAFRHYVKMTGLTDMRYLGTDNPVFFEYGENAGGSPDGVMGVGGIIKCGLELKCPADSGVHWDYLGMATQWDLKEYCIEYYTQMQFLMMMLNADLWHFASFDERYKDSRFQMKIIEIQPDIQFQQNLGLRLKVAIKDRDNLIKMKFESLAA